MHFDNQRLHLPHHKPHPCWYPHTHLFLNLLQKLVPFKFGLSLNRLCFTDRLKCKRCGMSQNEWDCACVACGEHWFPLLLYVFQPRCRGSEVPSMLLSFRRYCLNRNICSGAGNMQPLWNFPASNRLVCCEWIQWAWEISTEKSRQCWRAQSPVFTWSGRDLRILHFLRLCEYGDVFSRLSYGVSFSTSAENNVQTVCVYEGLA